MNPTLELTVASGRIDFYQKWDQDEPLIQEHKAADRCCKFEAQLSGFNEVFQFLKLADEAWREQVFTGELEVSKKASDGIKGLFTRWLSLAANFGRRLERIKAQGYEVSGAADYRICVHEAERIVAEWTEPKLSPSIGDHSRILTEPQSKRLRELISC